MLLTKEKSGNELVFQNGMANFNPSCPIDQSKSPPEVHGPEYSGWIAPKQAFPCDLEFIRKSL